MKKLFLIILLIIFQTNAFDLSKWIPGFGSSESFPTDSQAFYAFANEHWSASIMGFLFRPHSYITRGSYECKLTAKGYGIGLIQDITFDGYFVELTVTYKLDGLWSDLSDTVQTQMNNYHTKIENETLYISDKTTVIFIKSTKGWVYYSSATFKWSIGDDNIPTVEFK